MKKFYIHITLMLLFAIWFFYGCSKFTDLQMLPKTPTSVLNSLNNDENDNSCVWDYERNDFKFVCIEKLQGNVFKFVSEANETDENNIRKLRHPDKYFYLYLLIEHIRLGDLKFKDANKKEAFLNKLRSLIGNNMSYNGLFNKVKNDLLRNAEKWALNEVYYLYIESYLVYTLGINSTLEEFPGSVILAKKHGPIETVIRGIKFLSRDLLDWGLDFAACIGCRMDCSIESFDTYKTCEYIMTPVYNGIDYDFAYVYTCWIRDEDKFQYTQKLNNCNSNNCWCPGCVCDPDTLY
ncbi:hypothetical protein KAU32_03090 [bacterium]|nr:hypothetical protein [bacterium]